MSVRRREVLGALAVTALVYGIRRLTLGTLRTAPSEWIAQALAEMPATGAPGVAIVLPQDSAARDMLTLALSEALGDAVALTAFDEAVFVVADAADVGALPGE